MIDNRRAEILDRRLGELESQFAEQLSKYEDLLGAYLTLKTDFEKASSEREAAVGECKRAKTRQEELQRALAF